MHEPPAYRIVNRFHCIGNFRNDGGGILKSLIGQCLDQLCRPVICFKQHFEPVAKFLTILRRLDQVETPLGRMDYVRESSGPGTKTPASPPHCALPYKNQFLSYYPATSVPTS